MKQDISLMMPCANDIIKANPYKINTNEYHAFNQGCLFVQGFMIQSKQKPEQECSHPDYAMTKHGSTEICNKCGKSWG